MRPWVCTSMLATLIVAAAQSSAGQAINTKPSAAALARVATRQPSGCAKSEKYRELDFWVGTWNAAPWSSPPGTRNATNVVQPLLDSCLVLENYSGSGYEGKSFNYYDPHLDQWRQVWVDNGGTISDVVGGIRDGVFQLTGDGFNPRGIKIKRRMTLRRIAADTVRHTWEASTDDGKSWATVADVRYTRDR